MAVVNKCVIRSKGSFEKVLLLFRGETEFGYLSVAIRVCVWLLLQNRPESVAITTIMLNVKTLARSFLNAYPLSGLAVSMDLASDYLIIINAPLL